MTKKALRNLVGLMLPHAGVKATVILADRLKDLGYQYATRAGISISINNMIIPLRQAEYHRQGQRGSAARVEAQYIDGVITDGEKYNKVVDIWAKATEDVASDMMQEISYDVAVDAEGKEER